MLIPTVGGHEHRMSLRIVKQDEGTTSKDATQPPYQTSGNARISVDGLAMPINVAREGFTALTLLLRQPPELRRPTCQRICQAFSPISISHLRQKGFRVAISIRLLASGQQSESISGVSTQIPGSL